MTIQELFTRRAERQRPLTSQALAEQLGWPPAIVLRWAAFDFGIRESTGWTPEQIEQLCFLRATATRWR